MPEDWYTKSAEILEQCGYDSAIEAGNLKACYARKFNDSSVICEGEKNAN